MKKVIVVSIIVGVLIFAVYSYSEASTNILPSVTPSLKLGVTMDTAFQKCLDGWAGIGLGIVSPNGNNPYSIPDAQYMFNFYFCGIGTGAPSENNANLYAQRIYTAFQTANYKAQYPWEQYDYTRIFNVALSLLKNKKTNDASSSIIISTAITALTTAIGQPELAPLAISGVNMLTH